jgi:hypothetical protein
MNIEFGPTGAIEPNQVTSISMSPVTPSAGEFGVLA